MAFCIRPCSSAPSGTASPVPATPKESTVDPLDSQRKKILKAMDEKLAALEESMGHHFEDIMMVIQRHSTSNTPRSPKSGGKTGPRKDTFVQTEFEVTSVSTQTMDDTESVGTTLTRSKDAIAARDNSRGSNSARGSNDKRRMKKSGTPKSGDLTIDVDDSGDQDYEASGTDSPVERLTPSPSKRRQKSKEEAMLDARKQLSEARKSQMEARQAQAKEDADAMGDDAIIGEMQGARSLQSKMDAVALKWRFRKYPELSHWLSRVDGPLSGFVKRRCFKTVTSTLVFANIFFIVFQSSIAVDLAQEGKGLGPAFRVIDVMFSVAFGIDLCLRLLGERASFFYSMDRWWNILDFCLVSGDVFNEVIGVVMDSVGGSAPEGYFGTLRGAARACRAGRAARTLRVFRSVAFLTLPREVVASFTAVPLMISIYFFIALFFSLIFMQASAESYLDPNADSGDQERMGMYFGSVASSLVSLFFTLLGGMDWIMIYNTLLAASPLYSTIFAFFAFFAIVAYMNSITAMCVHSCFARADKADTDSRLEASKKLKKILEDQAKKDYFNPFVVRQDFRCTWGQLSECLDKPLVFGHLDGLGLDLVDAKGICKLMTHKESDAAQIQNFATACIKYTKNARGIDFLPLLLNNKKLMREMKELEHDLRDMNDPAFASPMRTPKNRRR